jgi:hypothetical protein
MTFSVSYCTAIISLTHRKVAYPTQDDNRSYERRVVLLPLLPLLLLLLPALLPL